MGERGPAPTPTEQLAPTSKRRAAREKTEPRPVLGEPEMPTDLSAAAEDVWHQLVETMPPGILSESDGHALACLCRCWVDWDRCSKFVAKYGEGAARKREGKDGSKTIYFEYFPQAAYRLKYEKLLAGWLAKFGRSASDRARITVQPPSGDGDAAVLKFFEETG